MRAMLAVYGIENRKVFVADSFEGLPKPDIKKYPIDEGDKLYTLKHLCVSENEVKENFLKYNLLDDKVIFLKGFFQDTLPNAPIDKLAILRADGDMYGSTMETLENLYPKLSKGGFCIIDDYRLRRCNQAVADYRKLYDIEAEIKMIDNDSVYWRT